MSSIVRAFVVISICSLIVVLAACWRNVVVVKAVAIPTIPALSLTPLAIKTFHFTWGTVIDETEFRLLENADGISGYTQVAAIAADAKSYDLVVSLPKHINASYILQACNSLGCADSAPVSVSGTLTEAVGYVKASNTQAGDEFGYSLALSADGNTLALGAINEASNVTGLNGDETDNSALQSGAVYVFTRSGAVWSQQAYVKASNTEEGDLFGISLALAADGNTLAVGAVGESSDATGLNGNETDNSASMSGAVYVFIRSGTGWSQQAYVKASNTGQGDFFGDSLALAGDGNTLAVGAPGEASNATGVNGDETDSVITDDSGAVYIFIRNNATWSQQAYIKASNTGGGDLFGSRLALAADGNTLAVGAMSESSNATGLNGDETDNSAVISGAVYIFIHSGAIWSQQAYVKASNAEQYDFFSWSVALAADGNTLAVGAHGEDSNATGLNGDETDNSDPGSGAVYIFIRNGTTWSQQAYVKASNTEGGGDEFGFSLALTVDGNTLAVGAINEASNAVGINGDETDNSALRSGAVYVFTRSSTIWSQQAYVKAPNTKGGDLFGYTLALTGDGNTLAVGALGEASGATGLNGDETDNSANMSGAVYLY